MSMRCRTWLAGFSLLSACPIALAQPDFGFDFVTVGAPGNAPYINADNTAMHVNGRGRVDYAFRITRTEISTGQWLEFLRTFQSNAMPHPFWDNEPSYWGGYRDIFDGTYHFGDSPDAERLPCGGITWYMAALYCNWLQNGKSSDPASLITGVYDSTTWGRGPRPFEITDAPVHMAGARYWIPTLDEQLKAFQYDPNRFGPGLGGWWEARNMSDLPGIGGPPGTGSTSAGWQSDSDPGIGWTMPLGAYSHSRSPWGLLDTSGGADEWNEQLFGPDYPTERGHMGSYASQSANAWLFYDHVWGVGAHSPEFAMTEGFRIATSAILPCSPDYNRDGDINPDDVSYLVNVVGGGTNPNGVDPDFNGDGNVDQDDVAALVIAVGGGGCP